MTTHSPEAALVAAERTVDAAARSVIAAELEPLLGALVSADSQTPPGDCRSVVAACATWLELQGLTYEIVAPEEHLPSMLVRLGSDTGPQLCWNAHLDTVPAGARAAWRTDPFRAERLDGQLVGLGAANCKGSAAAQLCAALALARADVQFDGSLVVTLVADEENLGSQGTGHLLQSGHIRPDFFVAGGPTRNHLVHAERGLMWLEVTVVGEGAHGAVPDEGRNAIGEAARLVLDLEEQLGAALADRRGPGLPASSMNVGLIAGGASPNMVAPECTFTIDRRLVTGEQPERAAREIADICERCAAARGFQVRTEMIRGIPAYAADPEAEVSRTLRHALRVIGEEPEDGQSIAISDARFVADREAQIVVFGPGDGRASHGPNESVSVAETQTATRALALSAVAMLSGRAS